VEDRENEEKGVRKPGRQNVYLRRRFNTTSSLSGLASLTKTVEKIDTKQTLRLPTTKRCSVDQLLVGIPKISND
jgi:hypothetical protein